MPGLTDLDGRRRATWRSRPHLSSGPQRKSNRRPSNSRESLRVVLDQQPKWHLTSIDPVRLVTFGGQGAVLY